MKSILLILLGFLLGAAAAGFAVYKFMPSQMIITKESMFGMDETVEMIDKQADENGWAVAKIWDMTERMEKAGFDDSPEVRVLELCHAENSYDVLKNEEDMFLAAIMPCRMAVYEYSNGRTFISRMNIGLISKMFSPNVKKVMAGVADDDNKILSGIVKAE